MRQTLFALLLLLLTGCADEWADYEITAPDAAARVWLDEEPFAQPERVCVDASTLDVPADAELESGPNGDQLCFWDYFSGTVPEGMSFGDLSSCELPFTQGPPWWARPFRRYESPSSLLNDEEWVTEADWVAAQIRAAGCSCCHSSVSGSGNTSGFDIDAPGVWTDSLETYMMPISSGEMELHRFFGRFEAEDNHGFGRVETLWPSTDPARLRAFFVSEFERREGTNADRAHAQSQFEALFGAVIAETPECVTQFEGVDGDGVLYWNGDDEVRQIWILEVGSESPGFPPTTDRPEGTLWTVYVDSNAAALPSGTVTLGTVPDGAVQMVPEAGAFTLEDGASYKVYASTDMMVGKVINCSFTWTSD